MRDGFEAAFCFLARVVLVSLGVAAFGLRLYGWHRMPRAGAVILASNHQSFLDPPFIGVTCPRNPRFLARKTLFKGAFGWILRRLGAIPMDRDSPDLAGLKEAIGALSDGNVLLVFPEGTRSRDGALGAFRPGISMLARRGKAVVVPCVIRGAFDAWPRWNLLPRPFFPIRVHYGEVVTPREGEGPRELGERVERAVHELWAATERDGGSSR